MNVEFICLNKEKHYFLNQEWIKMVKIVNVIKAITNQGSIDLNVVRNDGFTTLIFEMGTVLLMMIVGESGQIDHLIPEQTDHLFSGAN
ncbi:MAG: hypothetical protein ABSD71_03370 [Bacteroidales bacterium]